MLNMRSHNRRTKPRMTRKSLVVACVSLLLVGGSLAGLLLFSPSKRAAAQATAQALCQQYGLPNSQEFAATPVTLSASYLVNAGQVAAWDNSQYAGSGAAPPASQFASLPANQLLAVCYFSGSFTMPGGEIVPPGGKAPSYNTYV